MLFQGWLNPVPVPIVVRIFFAVHITVAQQVAKYDDRKCHEQHYTKTPHRFHLDKLWVDSERALDGLIFVFGSPEVRRQTKTLDFVIWSFAS